MEHWGEIKLTKIEHGFDFWCLFDELSNDNSNFINNREIIVDAYRKGNLYGLNVDESDHMFANKSINDDIFARHHNGALSWYLLPCLCVVENKKCIIIWVHTRARRKGLGTKLVKLLKIEDVYNPLPGTSNFWKSCGFN